MGRSQFDGTPAYLQIDFLTRKVEELEAKLAQRDDDYDEAWNLYQQSEDLISKYEALPKKWRAETYWDDPVEECSMAIEYIRDVAEEEAIKKVFKK